MLALEELAEALRGSLEEEPPKLPSELLTLRDADLADVLNRLAIAEAAHTLGHLPLETAIRLCDQPTLRRRGAIVEQLDPVWAGRILEGLSADERTYVLRAMSPHERHRLLPCLSAPMRAEV